MVEHLTPELTVAQRVALTALRDYIAANGISPTVRELAKLVDRNPNAVVESLARLEQADLITMVEKDGRRLSRGIIVNPAAAAIARAEPTPRKITGD